MRLVIISTLLLSALLLACSLSVDTGPAPEENIFCGGIAGKECPQGYSCQLEGNYPDAGGKCIQSAPAYWTDAAFSCGGEVLPSVEISADALNVSFMISRNACTQYSYDLKRENEVVHLYITTEAKQECVGMKCLGASVAHIIAQGDFRNVRNVYIYVDGELRMISPPKQPTPEEETFCTQDSDCVRQHSCCDCGTGRWVNKDYQVMVKCEIGCACMMTDARGVCENNHCVGKAI
jgi:hypothetical protein